MEQQEKQLLLKDLCSRLPCGVICHTEEGDGYLCSINQTIFGTEYGININPLKRDYFNHSETDEQAVKPYLRSMSSMTEEEAKEVCRLENFENRIICVFPNNHTYHFTVGDAVINWLNKNHFDYRGLIEKGLALEATEGMYKQ